MNDSLKTLLEPMKQADGSYKASYPASWRQGRTVYGGATSATAYVAAKSCLEPDIPLRSMQIVFAGPVETEMVLTPEIARSGKNVTTYSVLGMSNNTRALIGNFMFGRSRPSALQKDFAPPSNIPAPDACEEFAPESFKKFLPPFLSHFETKLAAGYRPASGAPEGYIALWCRSRYSEPCDEMGAFITMGDLLPPAVTPLLPPGPFKASSMSWQLNFLKDNVKTQDGWILIENSATAVSQGYSSQIMRYWNTEGQLLAEGTQTVAIFA